MVKLADYSLHRCLVVGASGFVGKVLCQQLQTEGIKVRSLLRTEQKGCWDESVITDLENFQQKEKELFTDIDTIYYLASIAHNKAPSSEYQKINVDCCLQFARSAIKNNVKRFIYVSSTKAMAEPGDQIVDETFTAKPKDKYGLSKRHAEEGLLALSETQGAGFEHLVIVRPCLIYGAGVQGNLYTMMHMIDKDMVPALPETKARRSIISVKDVARALIVVAKNSKANKQIYILAEDQPYSVNALEKSMRQQLGKKSPRFKIPALVFELAKKLPLAASVLEKLSKSAIYSSHKINNELGWNTTQVFNDVLPEMVEKYHSGRN